MTWSPFFTEVTPGPTSTTIPAPSCPRIAGNRPSGSPPERVNSSVWHTPVALSSTSTSPLLGPSRSTAPRGATGGASPRPGGGAGRGGGGQDRGRGEARGQRERAGDGQGTGDTPVMESLSAR